MMGGGQWYEAPKEVVRYPVVFKNMSNEQWNWLCNNIGKPMRDWQYNIATIWFFTEEDRTMFLLRWA
jgi:hypothetical protein